MSISEAAIDKIKNYSDEYIRANYEIIPWDLVCQYNKIDERTLRQFSHKLNWDLISQYQRFSEDFIIDYKHKLNMRYVCHFQHLSKKFIKELNVSYSDGKEILSYGDKMVNAFINNKKLNKDMPLQIIKNTSENWGFDFKICIKEVLENPKLPEEIKTKLKIDLMLEVVKM